MMARSVTINLRFSNQAQDVLVPFTAAVKSANESIQKVVKDILLLPNIAGELVVIKKDDGLGMSDIGEVFYKFEASEYLSCLMMAIIQKDMLALITVYGIMSLKLTPVQPERGKAAVDEHTQA